MQATVEYFLNAQHATIAISAALTALASTGADLLCAPLPIEVGPTWRRCLCALAEHYC